jgi:predicted nuclease with TOPRIM domain
MTILSSRECARSTLPRRRFILSNTTELHDKIESLQARIRELEAALAQLQSKVTSEPHPLLAQSLKTATEGLQSEVETSKDNESEDEDLIDTFGSLTIDTKGETVWYVVYASV